MEELRKIIEDHERRISALEKQQKPSKKSKVVKQETESIILNLKDNGFFNEAKTISQIKDALHTRGKIIKTTSLPYYLLKLVRNGSLKRKQEIIEKKKTWVYFV